MITPAKLFGLEDEHLVTAQSGHLLHEQTMHALEIMQQAAHEQGFNIAIASSFRSFDRQLLIWNNKFNGLRPVFNRQGEQLNMDELDDWHKVQSILLYSALPGTSRHHWGTDIDIYDNAAVNTDYKLQLEPHEYENGGPFAALTNWLSDNMAEFGFYRPYLEDLGGVAPELWHLSHTSSAAQYANAFKQHETELLALFAKQGIAGLEAIEQNLDYILTNYVYSVPAR